MMTTITAKRNGKEITKKVHDFALERTIASFRAAGYEIVTDAPAATETPKVEATAEQTGTVGKGREVHKIVAGHAVCGASYRRNSINSTTREVRITGQEATCSKCH